MIHHFRKKGFTLVETVLVMTGFFVLMVIVIGMYSKMIQLKYGVQARQDLIQNSYYVFERLNLLIKDYTIDYEEYFNRKHVGCDTVVNGEGSNFVRNINDGDDNNKGHCDRPTYYGNKNAIQDLIEDDHAFYYCSSQTGFTLPEEETYFVVEEPNLQNQGLGCFFTYGGNLTYYQSYGQYARQFWDVGANVDFVPGPIGDGDDEDLGKGPKAIQDNQNVQELYLISQDKTKRILLRRKLMEEMDINGDGSTTGDTEQRYNLQILKLRGFDAGEDHDFDTVSTGLYDGQIDTRACDRSQGFICHGNPIGGVYTGYNLPNGIDDGWVNMFEKNLTISDWNMAIYPDKDPAYAWGEDNVQINPYFTLSITTKLYGDVWQHKLGSRSIEDFELSLQTTFNTKNFYTK